MREAAQQGARTEHARRRRDAAARPARPQRRLGGDRGLPRPPAGGGGRMSSALVNGVELSYAAHGSGAPLILLHGGLGAGEQFTPLLPQFAGRQVITVDL